MSEISIRSLLESYGQQLGLRLRAGDKGLDQTISSSDVQRPALALTGFVDYFTVNLVQILGNIEIQYLRSLSKEKRRAALEIIYQFKLP